MQFKENPQPLKRRLVYLFLSFLFLSPVCLLSQTTYLPQGDKQNILLERLEIKGGTDSILNFSKTRPFSRRSLVFKEMNLYQMANHSSAITDPIHIPDTALVRKIMLSKVDMYNLRSAVLNNEEWIGNAPGGIRPDEFRSKKPIGSFYKTPANLYEVHVKDFDLIVNPVFQFVFSKESNNDQRLFLNTRGLTVRGKIASKIGFAAYITDNQERDPSYVQQWINDRKAVPGEGLYKSFKATGGVDYFDARGYFTFNATKYIDITFGYDKNFIGNGHRSLFLSDFGNNNLFLRLNTRVWKINYQNLFMELHSAFMPNGDVLLPKKYAAMHHLDLDVTKWLNIGLFEGIIFGRKDHFDLGYLNPIIFYRSAELQNGSYDNSVAGLDVKANLAHRFQLYGQLLLDEFKLSEIKANNGWWGNKYGFQLGVKYIDAFTIKNLDLQLEYNRVRPFTYSHSDSVANYTHYNQPLAHPLMANFSEIIGIARYQPAPKWTIKAELLYYKQGRDIDTPGARSFGSNIFLINMPPYRTGGDYGYYVGTGWHTNVFYGSLLVSYEVRENLFLELFGSTRKLETKSPPIISNTSTVISFGVRWNMHRREFDF
jgi:hypothetical protein